MDNILYISGEGIFNSRQNIIYHKYFSIHSTKNYFISRELKSIVSHVEIINFSWWFGHPRFIVKLESSGLRGMTIIKSIIKSITLCTSSTGLIAKNPEHNSVPGKSD